MEGDPGGEQHFVDCHDPIAYPTWLNDARLCQPERQVVAERAVAMRDERRVPVCRQDSWQLYVDEALPTLIREAGEGMVLECRAT